MRVQLCLHNQHCSHVQQSKVGGMVCRQAVSLQRQSKFRLIARKLDRLLTELEGELARASLTQQQREWAMFTVLRAYLCRRQCFEVMFDLLRLPQASMLESRLIYSSRLLMVQVARVGTHGAQLLSLCRSVHALLRHLQVLLLC